VSERLAGFHRERLESGAAFDDPQYAEQSGRADQQLIRDVRAATAALVDSGLTPHLAHTLIERAILVRYLEDRGVLTAAYFDEVASRQTSVSRGVKRQGSAPDFGAPSHFIRFLDDRTLTYSLFEQLAQDFNGDLFVPEPDERRGVAVKHLRLLRSLLQGTVATEQEPLFLWAYDFSVIPTNLVSTMYELFYRAETVGSTSTYYTPSELVEFVLADVLDSKTLDRQPTICDPACGSGIFLVEAYRRMVRHEAARDGSPLSSTRLRELLLSRIAGCDIDGSAIRLAAFSLYVAFLNYQSPQDIRSAGPLPHLIHRAGLDGDSASPLVVADAFSPFRGDPPSSQADARGPAPALPWPRHAFDIVVGNPPWTEPPVGAESLAEQWASTGGMSVGDRNPSQLFMWRALDLLSESGVASLLVSAKAIFNTRTTSEAFREQWLERARVEHVVNFSQVRRDFFEQGVAPFMLLRFRRAQSSAEGMVVYETARPVPPGRRGSSALARLDRQVVSQRSLRSRDYLWKTYSAGSLRDDAFLARLELESRLRDWVIDEPSPQYGYQRAGGRAGQPPSELLGSLRSLRTFNSWGPLQDEWFESVSPRVKRQPDERLYAGRRLLVRRGVSPGFGPHARIETEPLAFRHTTYAVSLQHLPVWQGKVILGTLLSSLGRYWLYMVSGSWGTWRDEVRSQDLLDLPLRMTSASDPATRSIVKAVDSFRDVRMGAASLWDADKAAPRTITSAIEAVDVGVFDLFELTSSERDLIVDFWAGQDARAVGPVAGDVNSGGTLAEVESNSPVGLRQYLTTFLQKWNRQLGDSGEFGWRVWRDSRAQVIAAVFEPRAFGDTRAEPPNGASPDWSAALGRLGVHLERRQTQSILRYGIVRVVTDTAIMIVKRDEQRLWTATAAREDADATTARLMAIERR